MLSGYRDNRVGGARHGAKDNTEARGKSSFWAVVLHAGDYTELSGLLRTSLVRRMSQKTSNKGAEHPLPLDLGLSFTILPLNHFPFSFG